jgi:hypothetical protein
MWRYLLATIGFFLATARFYRRMASGSPGIVAIFDLLERITVILRSIRAYRI